MRIGMKSAQDNETIYNRIDDIYNKMIEATLADYTRWLENDKVYVTIDIENTVSAYMEVMDERLKDVKL